VIERLLALPKYGAGIGLHRMSWALERLGAPFSAIKITGSNGKGSVAALTDAVMRALGVRTGLYTSPHLRRFNERIKVGGVDISDADLAAAIDWFDGASGAYASLHPDDTFGAFEAFTCVALAHYARAGVDTLVLEAGIGGRYDSTRVVPGPVCALTSIDLEHTAVLGATAELIAYDKADLCAPGGTLVVGPLEPELLRRLQAYAALRHIRLLSVDAAPVANVRADADGVRFDLSLEGEHRDLFVPLCGLHQVDNARIAALLVHTWAVAVGHPTAVLGRALREGFAAVAWPGRCEQVRPGVYIDVGHTPAAAATFCAAMSALPGPICLVLGVSHGKDARGVVRALLPMASEVICTRAHHNGRDAAEIEALVAELMPWLPRRREATIEAAMATAMRGPNPTVAVGGSLYLAVEADAVLRGEDPRELRFF
jgi:dihydrofolate synthase/folylpolyglutamate synthase